MAAVHVVLVTPSHSGGSGSRDSDSIGHHHSLKPCLSVSSSKAHYTQVILLSKNTTITRGPIIQTLKPGEGKLHIQTQTGAFQDCTNISTVHPQNFFIVPTGSFVTTR